MRSEAIVDQRADRNIGVKVLGARIYLRGAFAALPELSCLAGAAVVSSVLVTVPLHYSAAVVIGGTSLAGGYGGYGFTVIGVLVLQVLSSFLIGIGLKYEWQQFIFGLLILPMVALYGRSPISDRKSRDHGCLDDHSIQRHRRNDFHYGRVRDFACAFDVSLAHLVLRALAVAGGFCRSCPAGGGTTIYRRFPRVVGGPEAASVYRDSAWFVVIPLLVASVYFLANDRPDRSRRLLANRGRGVSHGALSLSGRRGIFNPTLGVLLSVAFWLYILGEMYFGQMSNVAQAGGRSCGSDTSG